MLLVHLAAISGLSVVEASHNHLDPHSVEWRGHTDDHPENAESAHAECVLCVHGGMSMPAANGAGVVHAPAVLGARAHIQPDSRLALADTGFSTRPRAPPVT